jgi:hypothetical protein
VVLSKPAHDARTDFAELTLVRSPHEPLGDRVWRIRRVHAAVVALACSVPLMRRYTCARSVANSGSSFVAT